MAEERVQRKLAAILAADVVGYSRLMEADEEGTLERLKTLRNDIIDPKIAEYGGRIFKTTGDGILAEFPSVADAVRHAVDVQRVIAQRNADMPDHIRIAFRIGISLGDVMIDGDDLFGNGVNVAARMEGLADVGGICVSGNVQEHIGNSLDVALEDMGEQTVKNFDRPVRCYRVHLEFAVVSSTQAQPMSLLF
jgi:adenylate cyclase